VQKKKRKKKKTGGGGGGGGSNTPSLKPPMRLLKEDHFTDYYVKHGQTGPEPTKDITQLFGGGPYPAGVKQEYTQQFNAFRMGSEEKKAMEKVREEDYNTIREAAEVHRQVRSWAQSFMKPGIGLEEMCTRLENKNRELVKEAGLERGIGFPTGCSLNHVAAHYTPNVGDKTVLTYDDVMKIDFGTQVRKRSE